MIYTYAATKKLAVAKNAKEVSDQEGTQGEDERQQCCVWLW